MKRLARYLATPFGLAVAGCLILAGWALWSGGILDGPIARQVRSSSVYAAPGTGLDTAAAQRAIGNRRLVVILLEPGADLRAGCHRVQHAAAGTLVLMLSRDGGNGYDTYGCSAFAGADDKHFGQALVSETIIDQGIDGFPDRPLDAIKVVAVNYDLLVKAGAVPDGARTISPSLPRYLIAAAAILAVLLGATTIYFGGRRAGRLAASRRARRDSATDARTELSARTAVLAQQIIDLDQRYGTGRRKNAFDKKYRQVASDYADLLAAITDADRAGDADLAPLRQRVEALTERAGRLSAT